MKNIILLSLIVLIPLTALANSYYELMELRDRMDNIKDHVYYGEIDEIADEVDMAIEMIENINVWIKIEELCLQWK